MKKIERKYKSVKVKGRYYTSIRSIYFDNKKKIVRLSHQSDICSDEEFLAYIKDHIPELKDIAPKSIYHDEVEWLCDWNVGSPKGGAFMISVFFF